MNVICLFCREPIHSRHSPARCRAQLYAIEASESPQITPQGPQTYAEAVRAGIRGGTIIKGP